MLRRAVLISAISALAGCTGYQPGSFMTGFGGGGTTFEGERATAGCLDVAIVRRPDHDDSAVLQYRFGNRCNRPIEVDLQHVAVVGRFDDGREEVLQAYDPSQELGPKQLGGRFSGREALAYPTPGVAVQVCADAASIVHAQPAQWLCFSRPPADPEAASEAASGSSSDADADADADAGADADADADSGADADAGADSPSLDVSPEATP